MPKGKAKKPYESGTIDLAKMRKKLSKGQPASSGGKSNKAKSKKNQHSLSAIKKGMSLQEVNGLIGEPTSSSSHVTGKTFNPFYYGSDHARLVFLYEGRGRILFSQRSSYTNTWRVILNPPSNFFYTPPSTNRGNFFKDSGSFWLG